MKKVILFFTALILFFTLTSCNNSNKSIELLNSQSMVMYVGETGEFDTRYQYSTSDVEVIELNNNAYRTLKEGSATITLNVKVGKTVSTLLASVKVNVKSEFVIEGQTLVAYTKDEGEEATMNDAIASADKRAEEARRAAYEQRKAAQANRRPFNRDFKKGPRNPKANAEKPVEAKKEVAETPVTPTASPVEPEEVPLVQPTVTDTTIEDIVATQELVLPQEIIEKAKAAESAEELLEIAKTLQVPAYKQTANKDNGTYSYVLIEE